MAYKITDDCISCGACAAECPVDAISEGDIAALSVICYYSPKSNYCAMQAFIYEDFVYNSVTKLTLKS